MPAVSGNAGGNGALALAGDSGAGLRVATSSLQGRLFFALLIICLTGVGLYGALTLLQALAGYLTAAAFILLAIVGGYLLLRVSLAAGRRYLPARGAGEPTSASTAQKGA